MSWDGPSATIVDMSESIWDEAAGSFDDAPDHGLRDPATRRAWADLLLPVLAGAGTVADIGCGTGTLTAMLAGAGFRAHGVDFSARMLEIARTKAQNLDPQPVFVLGDASSPSLPAGAFDAVLCRHVLWTLPHPGAALAAWTRLLAPGGRLVLIEGRWSTGVGLTARDCERLSRRTAPCARSVRSPTRPSGAVRSRTS